jgi:hypothetical protein
VTTRGAVRRKMKITASCAAEDWRVANTNTYTYMCRVCDLLHHPFSFSLFSFHHNCFQCWPRPSVVTFRRSQLQQLSFYSGRKRGEVSKCTRHGARRPTRNGVEGGREGFLRFMAKLMIAMSSLLSHQRRAL